MDRLLVCLMGIALLVPSAVAQSTAEALGPRQLQPTNGVTSNTIREAEALGDSLWIGPSLRVYVEEKGKFLAPDDPVVQERLKGRDGFVASIATRTASSQSVIWSGLGFDVPGEAVGAGGFLVSTDGGQSFEERPVQLDDPTDTTVTYGVSTLPAEPITREANSVPQDVAIGEAADTVWVAGTRSGLRRWTVQDARWSRVVLPPDTSTRIHPDTSYNFLVAPPLQSGAGFQNYVAFSVLVDETGTVWAGTAAGVNRSLPSEVGPRGDRAWRRFGATGAPQGLASQAVIALAEQPQSGERNPIWLATWALGRTRSGGLQRFGVAVTSNGGETFRSTLIGKRVYDVAARADRVYAAAESGLYVSNDQGTTWRSIEHVRLQNEDHELPGRISTRTVEVTSSALWVGTTEGLLRLGRDEEPRLLPDNPDSPPPQWRLFRTNVPVNPETPTERVPEVETYVYPNPFSPSQDQVARIVYNVPEPQTVEVNIYDFSMNRVRTLREEEATGRQEMTWDGTGKGGLRLPTGTYFYTVEIGGETVRGKILLSN